MHNSQSFFYVYSIAQKIIKSKNHGWEIALVQKIKYICCEQFSINFFYVYFITQRIIKSKNHGWEIALVQKIRYIIYGDESLRLLGPWYNILF